ncbi:MAG: ribose 5-phosphate isomerase B [Lentisphaerae bacterium]|nr:ribose 5-phosphate isomerase B [Lentisphaerota bacterium]
MKIAIGADHGGYDVKEAVKAVLVARGIEVEDIGCFSKESVDYPDYAREVASRVSHGLVEQGILICTSGIGMSIVANKFPRVRAALCCTQKMATMARNHNDANILVLSGGLVSIQESCAILDAWLVQSYSDEARHNRRLAKIRQYSRPAMEMADIAEEDSEMYEAIRDEWGRQQDTINLIASENYISRAAREAQGSVMTNKYAEGYPRKRWYNGCMYMDKVEQLAINRAKELFGAEHANVQPHCGSSANIAVYLAVLEPGDTILAMNLAHGGHLTHGDKVNISGRLFNFVSYGVQPGSEQIDYDDVARIANKCKPKLIVAGASAYSRTLHFDKFEKIAKSVGAYLMVDMAHIAGLVAAGCHPNPVPHAEFVTTTTHKTLRGSRGGLILCRKEFADIIDRQVFPGLQGGPLMHAIAAKAVCFCYALKPEFKEYGRQIVANARKLAECFADEGIRIVSGGTDNHLMLLDLTKIGITGRDAAMTLEKAGLIVNKNAIPFDKSSRFVTSGIRIGTPMVTTRGMRESEMEQIASMITSVLRNIGNETVIMQVREKTLELARAFPVS